MVNLVKKIFRFEKYLKISKKFNKLLASAEKILIKLL